MKYTKISLLLIIVSVVLAGCSHRGDKSAKKQHKQNNSMTNVETSSANEAAITAFYEKALTVNTETRPTDAIMPFLADGYKSYNSTGSKKAQELAGQLEFFWKIVPDMKWDVQEVIQSGDKYVVRSIATGSPNGDFMGIPTDGSKSFNIMTIDIHTIKDGKIMETHHIEDWATAMGQVKSAEVASDAGIDKQAEETMNIATAFMDSMGKGDMETMLGLMDENMVWHNEGDSKLPWIGQWEGKKTILEDFMPAFGANLETTKWDTQDMMAKGDTAVFFGEMAGIATKTKQETGDFTFALRVKVKEGKIVLWNWLEDSFAISQAYNGIK